MKVKLLAAALAGCLLLTSEPAVARHLAEQQAQRLEEVMGSTRQRRQPVTAMQTQQETPPPRVQEEKEESMAEDEPEEESLPEEKVAEDKRENPSAATAPPAAVEAQTEAQRLSTARMTQEREAREAREKAREAEAAATDTAETVAEEAARQAALPEQDQAEEAVTYEVKEALTQPAAPAATGVQQPEVKPVEEKKQEKAAEQPPAEQNKPALPQPEQDTKALIQRNKQAAAQRLAQHPALQKPLRMKKWPMSSLDGEGTLLFSSSPEYVKKPGLLYADVVKGKARVLYYHVNQAGQSCRMLVVLTNNGTKTATVRLSRGAAAAPSSRYLDIGKATQLAYFSQGMNEILTLPAGGSCLLRPEMEKIIMKPEDLIYGVYDFQTDETIKVSFVLCPVKEDALSYAANAPLLQREDPSAGRGTFVGMDRTLTAKQAYNPRKDGTVYIWLGNDKDDKFVSGIDATDGSVATNYGNYGINYKIRLPLLPAGRKQAGVWLNPCGGVYAGAMAVLGQDGSFGKMLPTPEGSVFFGEKPFEVEADAAGKCLLTTECELQKLFVDTSGGELDLVFSPPGASNLPARLILSPELAEKQKKR